MEIDKNKITKEITVELTSVSGVTPDNFDDVVKKVDELFGPKLQEVCGDMGVSVWPPDLDPEEQKKQFENKKEIQLFFMKIRE